VKFERQIMNDKNTECCPEFIPAPWDDKIFQWNNKKFIKDKVFTLFYIPMNFGCVMKRFDVKMKKAGSQVPGSLVLSDHTSKWNMDVYLAVDREIPDSENAAISGRFFSKVYEGDFKETGKWCKDFEGLAKNKGLEIKKLYMWYTTCPKCAKKYGKNYVVIIAQVG
jgi:hypothetical protein